MKTIELLTCPSGEWEVLKLDGDLYGSRDSIPNYMWIGLIKELTGIDVIQKEVSDDYMENGEYYED